MKLYYMESWSHAVEWEGEIMNVGQVRMVQAEDEIGAHATAGIDHLEYFGYMPDSTVMQGIALIPPSH